VPLKVEIIQATDNNPSFLIINGKETYPIKNVSFKGKGYPIEDDVKKSFTFDTGLLFFVDIFDQPHYYVNYEEDMTLPKNIVQNNIWDNL